MSLRTSDTTAVTNVKIEHIVPTIIKSEPNPDEQGHNGRPRATSIVKTRTSHEIIEILSDSEDGQSVHPKEEERSTSFFQVARTKNRKNEEEKQIENSELKMGGKEQMPSSLPFDPSMFMKESGTIWTDSDLTSFAVEGAFQVTKELRVDRVEYLTDIPNVWPIPKLPTAFILDLRDNRKYLVGKKPGANDLRTHTPATPDFLIKNKASIFRPI